MSVWKDEPDMKGVLVPSLPTVSAEQVTWEPGIAAGKGVRGHCAVSS